MEAFLHRLRAVEFEIVLGNGLIGLILGLVQQLVEEVYKHKFEIAMAALSEILDVLGVMKEKLPAMKKYVPDSGGIGMILDLARLPVGPEVKTKLGFALGAL